MRLFTIIICVWGLILSTNSFGAKKNKTKSQRKKTPIEIKLEKKEPTVSSRQEQWLFLSSLGVPYWKGLGLFTEFGAGYASDKNANWIPGINNQLWLVSGGSWFVSSVGAWYRSQTLMRNQTGLLLGAFIGAAFPSRLQGEGSTQIVPQLEASWVKTVEEFASWRLIGRASWISNRLSGQVSIGLIFEL